MSKTKLLVVEDNAQDRELLEHVLDQFSFDTTCVDTGYEAKEKFKTMDFHAVLMNMSIPDVFDPLYLIRWFRVKKPDVPIAIVSGNDNPSLRPKIYEAGAVMLFTKPYTSADNMGLLSLLEMRNAAIAKGRKTQNRYTTIFGVATIALGVASGGFHLIAGGVTPDWALITALITAGIGLIRAADADKKEK